MSPLQLHPELADLSPETIKQHLELVRVRRMTAAVTYFSGANARYEKRLGQLGRQLDRHYDLLGRDLAKLDLLIDKVENRANTIEMIRQDEGLTQDMVVAIPDDDVDKEDE